MKKYFLIIILIIASVLRLWGLANYPQGLNADEAALGYNAYSLLTTGRDEHGHSWPVNLESFGDFKPAGYAYILIPFIKIFGLTEFAVRLPSAIFGILGVLGIYLLCKEIFENSLEVGNWKLKIEEIAALLLAISPWHLHFSRGGWEVNVATTLLVYSSLFIVRWLRQPKLFYLLFAVCNLLFSMYVYQSTRIIAPLLGLAVFVLNFAKFKENYKQSLIALVLAVLLLLPLSLSLITSDASSRFSGVGWLADEGPKNRAIELRGQDNNKFLHNKPMLYALRLAQNYFDHWDGNFLFVNGDAVERNKIPETGLFYLTDAILFFIGIYFMRSKFVWSWFFIAPVAAALTFQTPHALRAHNLVIPMTIIIAAGLSKLINKKIFLILFIVVYSWQFVRYIHEYYVHYAYQYPTAWEYGFKELVAYVDTVKDKYSKIWVTDKYDQPYILFLFYSKYDPQAFQGDHKLTFRDKFNFSTVRDFGKYHFENTPWEKVKDIHNALVVAAPEDVFDKDVNVIKTINFPNGLPFVKIIEN
jgi:4-amino-4-deoxy-L-arabinose transferase-like glycosyltransferase